MITWMKRHKILMIFILIIVFYLFYYFPLQRICCERKLHQYMAEQGVDPADIESIHYLKDYTQDGYFADVQYKSDPDLRYEYHYYLLTPFVGDVECNVMSLIVFDNENCSVPGGMKYPPLKKDR